MRNPRKKALLATLIVVFCLTPTAVVGAKNLAIQPVAQQPDVYTTVDQVYPGYPSVATASEDKVAYQVAARELEVQKAKQEAQELKRERIAALKRDAARKLERSKKVQHRTRGSASGKANGVTATRKYKSGVEQWRSTVVKDLKKWGCYSKANEALAMRIINGESRGNPYAHRSGSQYYGLCQFGSGWVKSLSPSKYGTDADWRMNPYTSISKMTKCIRDGSVYQQFSTAR